MIGNPFSTGLNLPEGELFLPPPEPMMGMEENGVKKSSDMFPSRKGKSEGEANKKIGSGEEGSTRPDQLAK